MAINQKFSSVISDGCRWVSIYHSNSSLWQSTLLTTVTKLHTHTHTHTHIHTYIYGLCFNIL